MSKCYRCSAHLGSACTACGQEVRDAPRQSGVHRCTGCKNLIYVYTSDHFYFCCGCVPTNGNPLPVGFRGVRT